MKPEPLLFGSARASEVTKARNLPDDQDRFRLFLTIFNLSINLLNINKHNF